MLRIRPGLNGPPAGGLQSSGGLKSLGEAQAVRQPAIRRAAGFDSRTPDTRPRDIGRQYLRWPVARTPVQLRRVAWGRTVIELT